MGSRERAAFTLSGQLRLYQHCALQIDLFECFVLLFIAFAFPSVQIYCTKSGENAPVFLATFCMARKKRGYCILCVTFCVNDREKFWPGQPG